MSSAFINSPYGCSCRAGLFIKLIRGIMSLLADFVNMVILQKCMPDKVLEGWQGKRPRAPPRGFSSDRTPNKGIQAYISAGYDWC